MSSVRQYIKIVYPRKGYEDIGKIEMWYADAVANGEVKNKTAQNTRDKALALHDAGIITLAINWDGQLNER